MAKEVSLGRNEKQGHCAHDANADRDQRAVANIGPGREQDQRGHADHLDGVYSHVLTMSVREGRQSAEAFLTMACANASRWGYATQAWPVMYAVIAATAIALCVASESSRG